VKVLLAEDDSDIRRIYTEMLSGNGFEVFSAVDGEDVLTQVGEQAFDLLILDLFMPRVDGFEALTRLREQGQMIPVIVMTGHFPETEVDARIQGLGVSTVLRKPVMISTLLDAVKQAVGPG
jgi:CheY-like chemotaxis protein